MRTAFLAAALTVAFAATGAQAAGNLVQNGNFSEGWNPGVQGSGFDHWTKFGDNSFTISYGDNGLFGPYETTGGIWQDLATQAGHTYAVSFQLMSDGPDLEHPRPIWSMFKAEFGADVLRDVTNEPFYDFVTYAYQVQAPTDLTRLTFTFRQDPGFYHIKDIVVRDLAGVPEPATWALMIGGFALAGLALRRRPGLA